MTTPVVTTIVHAGSSPHSPMMQGMSTTHACAACGGELAADYRELLAEMDSLGISASEALCAACDEIIEMFSVDCEALA
jgi:hypothetical protein